MFSVYTQVETKQQMTLDDVDASLDALAGNESTTTTLVGTLTGKMNVVRDLFAAVDQLELHKAINRAAEKKAELAAAVSAKTARAKELSQVAARPSPPTTLSHSAGSAEDARALTLCADLGDFVPVLTSRRLPCSGGSRQGAGACE